MQIRHTLCFFSIMETQEGSFIFYVLSTFNHKTQRRIGKRRLEIEERCFLNLQKIIIL